MTTTMRRFIKTITIGRRPDIHIESLRKQVPTGPLAQTVKVNGYELADVLDYLEFLEHEVDQFKTYRDRISALFSSRDSDPIED